MDKPSVIRPTDDEARSLAGRLMAGAGFAALAVRHPDDGSPFISRIGFSLCAGGPATLISALAVHTQALRADPACALLLGEPGDKGDPLIHPRLTLQAKAEFIPRDTADHDAMARDWLKSHPKAGLYIGFADFGFVRFAVRSGHLNGGFGKAFVLTAADLGL